MLDEELNALPEKYRLPLILCYLEGQTNEEAARRLGWPAGTVKSRLSRGRVRLRRRLARRGLGLAAGAFAAVLAAQSASAALPAALLRATLRTAEDAGSGAVPARVGALTEGVHRALFLSRLRMTTATLLTLTALATGAGLLLAPPPAPAPPPSPPAVTSRPHPRSDRYGDPLPGGAIARLGTARFRHGGGTVDTLLLSPDGKTLISKTHYGTSTVCAWELATGKLLREFPGHFEENGALALSPDGKTLATGSDTRIPFWDLATGRELARISAGMNDPTDAGPEESHFPRGPIVEPHIIFSPDGKLLAMNRWQKTIPVWEAATGRERLRLKGHEASTECVAFSPDGRTLASASWDHTIRLWDLATGTELRRLMGHRGHAHALAFTDSGRRLISAGDDATLLVWDVAAVTERERHIVPLSSAERTAAWEALAGDDAARAHTAIARLVAAGQATVEQLRQRLAPAPGPDPARLAQLMRDLENNTFAIREKAAGELERLGDQALPAVEQGLTRTGVSLELRRRLERLRDQLTVPSGDALRAIPAVEVLEQIASPASRRLLETLSRGAPAARLTREAKAATVRLGKHV